MGEYLPGNLQERLRELREENGYKSMSQLADEIGIDRTTYGRIESGTTKTINSDLLIRLSSLYDVPADYILGLCDPPEKTGYDIKELGLSVEAAKNLYSGKVDAGVVNELLQNDKFASATKMMRFYFAGSVTQPIKSQNELLDFSYSLLNEMNEAGTIPDDLDIRDIRKRLRAAKLSPSHMEIDRIERQLVAAVKEIRKKVKEETSSYERPATLDYEIVEKVKTEALAHPGLKDLPEEERMSVIKAAVMKGIQTDPDVTEKQMKMIEPLVDGILPLLVKLWKEKI